MDRKFITQVFIWGFALWLFGYALGFLFYPFLATDLLGKAIMPFGILATIWVLRNKVNGGTLLQYATMGLIWTVLAVVLDYAFLVKLLHPADGYYKLDVYIYYALTFLLPCAVGFWKRSRPRSA
ncbi:MAG: hypothetical protein ABJA10_06000 [Aestuariivirga sp.]